MKQKVVNGMFSTILPSSLYPSTYAGLPEDIDDWNCSEWDAYFNRNRAISGEVAAMEVFNLDTSRTGMWANLELCKLDCNFVNKYKALGFNTTLVSDIYCGAEDVTDAAGNILSGVAGLSKIALPIAVISAAFYFKDDIKKLFT